MAPLVGNSNVNITPAVTGTHTAGGLGLEGTSNTGTGVHGLNAMPSGVVIDRGAGVWGDSTNGVGVHGTSRFIGVQGDSTVSHGVYGVNQAQSGIGPDKGAGVWGDSQNGFGVFGTSTSIAVVGRSTVSHGVYGINQAQSEISPDKGAGVWGDSQNGYGVFGTSGIVGKSTVSHGVYGVYQTPSGLAPDRGVGVWGDSRNGVGVLGTSAFIGVVGEGTVLAARFKGTVEVTGDILLPGADCAEQFDVALQENVGPGTVVVINERGELEASQHPYDKKVAGVISGAGNCCPGILLDKQETANRLPVALVGKVYCKVDAAYSRIGVGDLLTTSPTPGHAMRASDPLQAFGAVIGKALKPWHEGCGLIPILIALQ
jgi:hypothetical protein